MADVLVVGDTIRCPELRHEVPLDVADPFVYLEVAGGRHVYAHSMETARIAALDTGLVVHPLEEIGYEELRRSGRSASSARVELAARACAHAGLRSALVPQFFPAGYLDRIRADGVELVVDQDHFDERRRVKTPAQLEGIRRAQRAAEQGVAAAVEIVRGATIRDGVLWSDGAILTAEGLRAAIGRACDAAGAATEDVMAAPGPQGAAGHDLGSGPIRAGEPIVIDLWPRDRASACFTDMTRTICAGEPSGELVAWHALVREALERATGMIRPGVAGRDVFDAVCDVFEADGHPTIRTKPDGQVLADGFFHSLGHGVGLEVHEPPAVGLTGRDVLVAGDVVAIEPGLYRSGRYGVRLEDLVLVTDDGYEVLTDFPYDLEVAAR